MQQKKRRYIAYYFATVSFLLMTFQNCSKIRFMNGPAEAPVKIAKVVDCPSHSDCGVPVISSAYFTRSGSVFGPIGGDVSFRVSNLNEVGDLYSLDLFDKNLTTFKKNLFRCEVTPSKPSCSVTSGGGEIPIAASAVGTGSFAIKLRAENRFTRDSGEIVYKVFLADFKATLASSVGAPSAVYSLNGVQGATADHRIGELGVPICYFLTGPNTYAAFEEVVPQVAANYPVSWTTGFTGGQAALSPANMFGASATPPEAELKIEWNDPAKNQAPTISLEVINAGEVSQILLPSQNLYTLPLADPSNYNNFMNLNGFIQGETNSGLWNCKFMTSLVPGS